MPITIIHATCSICGGLLPADDVLPCKEGEAYSHAACLLRDGLIPLRALAVIPRLLSIQDLRMLGVATEANALVLSPVSTLAVAVPAEHALSPSTAHVLVSRSPLHAWWRKFGGAPKEYTDPTEFGNLCHALLLGGQQYVAIDADDWRTNKAKADRAEARAANKIPVLKERLRQAEDIATDARRRLLERGYDLTKGERELDVTWREGDVLCRGRVDWWEHETGRWLDLKFVVDASMEACVRHMLKYGAAIQDAAYTSALEARHPEMVGRVKGKFAFFESEPPSGFCIRASAGTMRAVGRGRWRRAVGLWKSCLERYGTETPWPGYDADETEMEAPAWALDQEAMSMEVRHDEPF